jgi:hypothetical protein
MGARFGSWWQKIKQHRVAIGVTAIVLVVVIALIIAGYWFDWTGFNGYNKVTIAHTISGTNAGTVTKTEEYQPGKGLWDWLNLLGVLAIPAVVGLGAAWYTAQQGEVSERENKDNQREAALQDYIDKMSELLLAQNLRNASADEEGQKSARVRTLLDLRGVPIRSGPIEVQKSARVRTLTVLRGLDAERKGSVLRFLYESGLIDKDNRIIDLSYADLRNASLGGADLSGANLRNASLSVANLSVADLGVAGLSLTIGPSNADLSGAIVTSEQLDKARSLKDTILQDGSKHSD